MHLFHTALSEILVQKHVQKIVSDDPDGHDDYMRTLVPNEYERLENAKYEFSMGLYQNHEIKKLGKNWGCKNEKCTKIKGHDKFAAYVHVNLNHVVPEIRARLGIMKEYSLDMQSQELEQFNLDQLNQLAAHVEHGSTLEKQIRLAIDYLLTGGRF